MAVGSGWVGVMFHLKNAFVLLRPLLTGVYIGMHIIASHHCIHSSHSVVASGRPSLLVSLITLCVSSDRKGSRQVEEVDLFCFRSRNIVERFRTTASWTTPEWNPVMHLDGIPFRGCPRTDTCWLSILEPQVGQLRRTDSQSAVAPTGQRCKVEAFSTAEGCKYKQ